MIVTSIGERCFFQNWLWKQHQAGVLEYHENMLSRLQEYPYPSKYPQNLIPDKISRYEDFCKSFVDTGSQKSISGHDWFVSEKEGCMTHYVKNINFNDRQKCLTQADAILYTQMYNQPNMNPEELANHMVESINKFNHTNPRFIMFTPFVEESMVINGGHVLKIDECPYWDMANWEKSSKKETPDPEYNYLKGWRVTQHDAELIELVLDALK